MAVRLSILRGKGWYRAGIVGAVAMIPYTTMQHALGVFSEGARGLEQAVEYYVSGAAVALIIGFSAAWIAHGFAVRAKVEEEEGDSERPASSSSRPAPGPAGGARGRGR